MSVIRAFIALDLSIEILQRLEQLSHQLKARLGESGVRWVPVHNIHLTLEFLGDVSVTSVEMLKKVLQGEVMLHRPFDVSVGGLGAFPTTRRPRVVWVGVEAPPNLAVLQSGIENKMEKLGYAREERPFSPHLTLGRVSRNTSPDEVRQIGEVLEATKVGFLGLVRMREVYLYKSDLKPSGAEYTRIFTVPLSE